MRVGLLRIRNGILRPVNLGICLCFVSARDEQTSFPILGTIRESGGDKREIISDFSMRNVWDVLPDTKQEAVCDLIANASHYPVCRISAQPSETSI